MHIANENSAICFWVHINIYAKTHYSCVTKIKKAPEGALVLVTSSNIRSIVAAGYIIYVRIYYSFIMSWDQILIM